MVSDRMHASRRLDARVNHAVTSWELPKVWAIETYFSADTVRDMSKPSLSNRDVYNLPYMQIVEEREWEYTSTAGQFDRTWLSKSPSTLAKDFSLRLSRRY